ncbi:hypothetical protein Q3G72_020355 [Acer saccharum]|nr:hypothetical protein Q3G72_020355 [Acer saccharum]
MHQLNHLQRIDIWDCSSLVTFPAGGFPSTNLTEVEISKFEKLKTLPNGMRLLNHLQKIKISNYSSLVSFLEGGLPCTSLTELDIYSSEKLKGLPNCMHNLTSLREVRISHCQGMEIVNLYMKLFLGCIRVMCIIHQITEGNYGRIQDDSLSCNKFRGSFGSKGYVSHAQLRNI